MSCEFIQFHFPCKDCLVRAACKEKPKDEDVQHLFMDGHTVPCLALPKIPLDVKSYHKGLLECWANIGVNIICRMSKKEDPKTCTESNNNIPMQYVILMGNMIYLLQWMINSTSWNEGLLKDFDKLEINRKVKLFGL